MSKGAGTSAATAVEKRIGALVEAGVKERSSLEGRVAGAARALAPFSTALRGVLAASLKELVKLEAFDRELYSASTRALVDAEDKRLAPLVLAALKTDEFGGLPALSAACFSTDAALAPLLVRAAACSKTQLAFGAEVARVCRGEPTGPRLAALAPRIKEAHRISLAIDLLLPICQRVTLVPVKACAQMADALHVLRGSERHLGRWLIMAEIAHRGGDPRPLKEAVDRTTTGPDSSRAAWSLVAWALSPERGTGGTRPTSELVARLSHRPSADRDASFLFRMADARVEVARSMLEALARTKPLGEEVALRAACALAKHFDRPAFTKDVIGAVESGERDDLRALAAASLFDLGERERAAAAADQLAKSDDLTAQTWAALILQQGARTESAGKEGGANGCVRALVDEPTFRRVQWGWIE